MSMKHLALVLLSSLLATVARAETIRVTPSDDFAEIERAQPGDVVEIEPGTYRFRVFLTGAGTEASPIVIRAADPTNPPVWDLSGMLAEDFPGSSTRGDRGRGCWQIAGSYYEVSGLVIRGCTTSSGNGAGLRAVGSDHVTISDVVFDGNEVGMSGDGEDTVVEFSEFVGNGVRSSPPQHSIYIFGGSFTLRHSYVHDSVGGQNLHIRARRSVIEYNWIARASNYEVDMMTGPDRAHEMTFVGNVLITNEAPENSGQIFVLYNDVGRDGVSMRLRMIWNTIVVQGTGDPALVNVRNDSLDSAEVEIANNVIVGTDQLLSIRDAASTNWALSGGTNHLPTGTDVMGLTGNVLGDDPGFADAASLDLRPGAGSPLIGLADLGVGGPPAREYAENEMITRRFRPRASAADIGAFEHDTMGGSFGPRDDPMLPPPADAGVLGRDAGAAMGVDGGAASADAGASELDAGPDAPTTEGCSCRAAGARPGVGLWLLLGALVVRRRRRHGGSTRSSSDL